MSSQSSIYDDPVESFDKLNLDDQLNDSNKSDNQATAKHDEENSKSTSSSDNKEDYLEDFFNINNQHRLENKYCIWFSKL